MSKLSGRVTYTDSKLQLAKKQYMSSLAKPALADLMSSAVGIGQLRSIFVAAELSGTVTSESMQLRFKLVLSTSDSSSAGRMQHYEHLQF